jgi:hypothetical protein
MLFSGHATSTKHSISAKLASFAGLSLPTETVYDFLWARARVWRRCLMRGRYDAVVCSYLKDQQEVECALTNAERADKDAEDVCVACALDDSIAPHE